MPTAAPWSTTRDRLRVAASASFGGTGAHRYTYDAQDNLRTHVTGDTSYEYYYDGANRLTNLMNVATGVSEIEVALSDRIIGEDFEQP
ncbi:hypothetical protein [Xanthomonas sp. NCPPB 1754]|uniref:hypothetical protein n=1 Tax=Xanthomonas sp. NCPPB 1754 TaxID=487536 RepID=UPI003556DAF6